MQLASAGHVIILSTMGVKKVKDFVVEDNITSYFSVRRKELREFTRGQYVSLEIADNTARIPAVYWDPDAFALNELEEGMVVKIRGTVTEYRNKLQVTIKKIRLALDNEYEIEDILPHSPQSKEHRRQRVIKLKEQIINTHIKNLVDSFLEDEEFFDAYLNAAAGKLWHHAYIGGLSEHSANVADLALQVADNYSFLDKDLVIFGGLMHDAGKVKQYASETMIDYTDEGRLVGHISIIDNWLCEKAHGMEAFPESLLTKLRHIILSHHGENEYGSPVVPQMPEAFIVYYCDEIDSKMGAITRIRDRQDGVGWSPYVNMLSRFLYFGEKDEPEE